MLRHAESPPAEEVGDTLNTKTFSPALGDFQTAGFWWCCHRHSH
jgi:hypothetical protein